MEAWSQLRSGNIFYPLRDKPNWQDVHITDIALGMSCQARFGGQLVDNYTVTEHCCLLHDFIKDYVNPSDTRLLKCSLLHDGMEGLGLPDVQYPFKEHPKLAGYKALDHEKTIELLAYYGISSDVLLTLKEYDTKIAVSEAYTFFYVHGKATPHALWKSWIESNEQLPIPSLNIRYLTPPEAVEQWLIRWLSLGE